TGRLPGAGDCPDRVHADRTGPDRTRAVDRTGGDAMIRVLLVDDHAMLRAGFRAIHSTQPDIEVVGEATTGAEGVRFATELQPDVITMDVQMLDMDGIEATRRIVADPAVAASIAIVTT